MEDLCRGCFELNLGEEGFPSWCPVVPIKGKRHCPCTTCIVKMLECDEPCDEWIDYDQHVNGDSPRG